MQLDLFPTARRNPPPCPSGPAQVLDGQLPLFGPPAEPARPVTEPDRAAVPPRTNGFLAHAQRHLAHNGIDASGPGTYPMPWLGDDYHYELTDKVLLIVGPSGSQQVLP